MFIVFVASSFYDESDIELSPRIYLEAAKRNNDRRRPRCLLVDCRFFLPLPLLEDLKMAIERKYSGRRRELDTRGICRLNYA